MKLKSKLTQTDTVHFKTEQKSDMCCYLYSIASTKSNVNAQEKYINVSYECYYMHMKRNTEFMGVKFFSKMMCL